MDAKARRSTNITAGVAAVVSFVVAPIPGADELVVVPMHFRLAKRLGKQRGLTKEQLPWKSIKKIVWWGAGARLVGNVALGEIPIVGSFANSFTAIVLTEYLSRWIDAYLADPANPPPEVTREIMQEMFDAAVGPRGRGRGPGGPGRGGGGGGSGGGGGGGGGGETEAQPA
jgi:uncharacterized protein (DUF697 family)